MRAKYIGKNESLGFVKGNEYEINVDKRKYGYEVISTFNYTQEREEVKYITHSSQISVDNNWEVI